MKILAITRDARKLPEGVPAILRVGEPVADGAHVVSEILYCRDGYSGGSKGRFPAYAVKFLETTEVRVIPESAVIDLAIDPETKTKNVEADVPLPD